MAMYHDLRQGQLNGSAENGMRNDAGSAGRIDAGNASRVGGKLMRFDGSSADEWLLWREHFEVTHSLMPEPDKPHIPQPTTTSLAFRETSSARWHLANNVHHTNKNVERERKKKWN